MYRSGTLATWSRNILLQFRSQAISSTMQVIRSQMNWKYVTHGARHLAHSVAGLYVFVE